MSAWIGRRRPLAIALAVIIGVTIAAAIVVVGLYGRAPRATRVHVGEVAPDFELPVVTGEHAVRLSGNRGGPNLLLFFDTRWPGSDEYLKYVERI